MRKFRNKMTIIAFISAFFCLALVWLILQLVLFNTCLDVDNQMSGSAQIQCQREKAVLILHTLNLMHKQPECSRAIQKVKDFISPDHLPTIFVITPTYTRPVQKAELTRLLHTFLLVPHLHWILVEDAPNRTNLVTHFLKRSHIQATHLNVLSPEILKTNPDDPNWLKPRGVFQRNLGLSWLRDNIPLNKKGVVYFADDDNTYDLELFDQMRNTKRVSVWPVGLVGGLMVEKPLVENGKVVGWNTVWKPNRPFPIDMAGFAVNLKLLLEHQTASFSMKVPRGYQESKLLKNLITFEQLEPMADNCTKVLVWHTRTEKPKLKQEVKLSVPSDKGMEV